jgi:U3 small nucleolar RNA-associated protein 11
MSSLRNSLHRRNHKERSQLSHRQRFGILEKHKDYVLRARDYHSKQDRIKRLRQKAAERNKDEFYFGMNRERTEVYAFSPLRYGTRVLTIRTCVGRQACAGSREC